MAVDSHSNEQLFERLAKPGFGGKRRRRQPVLRGAAVLAGLAGLAALAGAVVLADVAFLAAARLEACRTRTASALRSMILAFSPNGSGSACSSKSSRICS